MEKMDYTATSETDSHIFAYTEACIKSLSLLVFAKNIHRLIVFENVKL